MSKQPDYWKGKPAPTIGTAKHKIILQQPMPKPAPKPGHKGQGTSGSSPSVDGKP